jgi:hypothetical protein
VNTPLRIEITDNAQAQISVAAAWWAEHRPAAPGAIHEELDRVLDLLRLQPEIGTLGRRATLSGEHCCDACDESDTWKPNSSKN